MLPYFMGLFAALGVGWILWSRWAEYAYHKTLPTLGEYKRQHPDAGLPKGGVKCCHCGSNQLYLWWLWGPRAGGGPKRHICRSCGETLYRSG